MKLEEMKDYKFYKLNKNGYEIHYKDTDKFVMCIKDNNRKCYEIIIPIIKKYFGEFEVEETYKFEFVRFGTGCCECCNFKGYKITIKKPSNAANVFLDIFLNKNTEYQDELDLIKMCRGSLFLINYNDKIELMIG